MDWCLPVENEGYYQYCANMDADKMLKEKEHHEDTSRKMLRNLEEEWGVVQGVDEGVDGA